MGPILFDNRSYCCRGQGGQFGFARNVRRSSNYLRQPFEAVHQSAEGNARVSCLRFVSITIINYDCFCRDENGGIEMQVLSSGANGSGGPAAAVSTGETSMGNNNSNEISQANSALSIDYPEQVASTIGQTHYTIP